MRPIAILWIASINAAAGALALTMAPTQHTLEPRYLARPTAPAPAPDAVDRGEIAQTIRKYALNALLVPVLDDDDYPARWRAEILVLRDDDGVSAIARFIDLKITHRGQSLLMNEVFTACTP